jgi:hypothetical protein
MANAKALLDYSALDVEDVDPTERPSQNRNSNADVFVPMLNDSRETGKDKRIVVPTEAVSQASSLIRNAAQNQPYGVGIRTADLGNGSTAITFYAKDKRVSKPKSEDAPKPGPRKRR